MEHTETVFAWTHHRRLHLVAPTGILGPVDLATIEKLVRRIDDLDQAAEAVALVVGRPVRRRPWEPPTSDFFLEVETFQGSPGRAD